MALTDIQKTVGSKTQKAIDAFQTALAKFRTGRATPASSTPSWSTTTAR